MSTINGTSFEALKIHALRNFEPQSPILSNSHRFTNSTFAQQVSIDVGQVLVQDSDSLLHPNLHSLFTEPNQTAAAPAIESATVGGHGPSSFIVATFDRPLPHEMAHAAVTTTTHQSWLRKKLAAVFGSNPVTSTSSTTPKSQPIDKMNSDGSRMSVSTPSTCTTLTYVQSTAFANPPGAMTLARRQSTIDRGIISPLGTATRRPSLPQLSRVADPPIENEAPSTGSISSARFSDARAESSARSSAASSIKDSQVSTISSATPDRSLEWYYTVGRSAGIDRSLSSVGAADVDSSRHGPAAYVARTSPLPDRPPPAIVTDTCDFVSRFGTSNVYTEPSDDEFLSRYSPHVNAWSSMYDPIDGSRLDPARDPVSFTMAKFGQHRKTVAWAAMEALRYWLLARHTPVVPLTAFQTGYRMLVAAEPGKVAETLIEHLRQVICKEGDWGTFKHIVGQARKEATRYPGTVVWMAKDWGSALAQVEDRHEWKSEWEVAKWMEGTMMPVMVVLLTSKAQLE